MHRLQPARPVPALGKLVPGAGNLNRRSSLPRAALILVDPSESELSRGLDRARDSASESSAGAGPIPSGVEGARPPRGRALGPGPVGPGRRRRPQAYLTAIGRGAFKFKHTGIMMGIMNATESSGS